MSRNKRKPFRKLSVAQHNKEATVIINKYQDFLYKTALNCFRGNSFLGLQIDDLIQEGCIGIFDSIPYWNPALKTSAATFALYYARFYMLNAIRDKSSIIRFPTYVADMAHQYNTILREKGYKQASQFLVGNQTTLSTYMALKNGASPYVMFEGEEIDITAELSDSRSFLLEDRVNFTALLHAAAITNPIHYYVAYMRYRGYTLVHIAKVLGLTKERIRQLGGKVIDQIRHFFKGNPAYKSQFKESLITSNDNPSLLG